MKTTCLNLVLATLMAITYVEAGAVYAEGGSSQPTKRTYIKRRRTILRNGGHP